jgi:hypothetical protein
VGTSEKKPTHVGNVKYTDGISGLVMFLHDALVLDRHGPACKTYHATMMFGVPLMKRRFKKLINGGHNIPLEID